MTYKQIKDYVEGRYGKNVETCHIAYVKRINGYPMRTERTSDYTKKCPADLRPLIKEVLHNCNDN